MREKGKRRKGGKRGKGKEGKAVKERRGNGNGHKKYSYCTYSNFEEYQISMVYLFTFVNDLMYPCVSLARTQLYSLLNYRGLSSLMGSSEPLIKPPKLLRFPY